MYHLQKPSFACFYSILQQITLALAIEGATCKLRELIFFETQPIIVYRLTANALFNLQLNENALTLKVKLLSRAKTLKNVKCSVSAK